MANGAFQHGVKRLGWGDVVWKAAGGSNMRVNLIDTLDYAVDLANHDFMNDVAVAAREEESGNMTLVDVAADGIFDASDVTLVGTAGDQCEAILLKRQITDDTDSFPFLWWDTASGLPVTLGGDVTIAWSNGADKILHI